MVTLWTRQDIRSLDDLEKYNVFRNKQEFIEEQFGDVAAHFIRLYTWFVNAANSYVPKPKEVEFPIWCSISYENMLRPIEGTVVYEIVVPESEIIYFDGVKWDYVLNHIYIPTDEEDGKRYSDEMRERGFSDTFSFIDGKYSNLFPEERKRVMDSWYRIFNIENWDIFNVQANIWEIRPEMIKDILYYNEA